MKNLLGKLIPAITKLSGKKPIVIIFSVLLIGLGVFAIQKGYIGEESINFGLIIDQIDQTFIDSLETGDTIEIIKVDTIFVTIDSTK
jgi:hypothetical protein